MVKKCGLEEKITLRHLLYRVMTAVGRDAKDAHPPKNMKKYTRGQKSKENKGNMYKSMFLVLDYWVDCREYPAEKVTEVNQEDPHPLKKLKREMSERNVYLEEVKQVQVLGVMEYTKVKGPVYDTISIVEGFHERFPRLYHRESSHVSYERASAFLNYLVYKGLGKMSPKHTALYFADTKVEPFYQVLFPIAMHRYAFNRWARHYYKFLFAEKNHTCSATGPYPFLDNGKKKMSCELATFKERLVAAAGHDPSHIAFEHMTHGGCRCGGGCNAVQGMLTSEIEWEESQRLEFCFHRNPHSCARCCATDPIQEFFIARTRDHPFLACYHPIHLNQALS